MSKDSDFGLDLDLQLLPEWARESSTVNRYANYQGESERGPRGRREDSGFSRRPRPDRDRSRPPRGDKRGGGRGEGPGRGRPGPGPGADRRGPRRERPPRREEIPLPDVEVSIVPEEAGVRSLAQQIKLTGRAYPLFDIASLILKRQERFHVVFSTRRNAEGQVSQALFTCPLDDSVWLSVEEVAQHVLSKHLETLYEIGKIPAEPPKGTYTLVAQCPLSNVILGPPNLHDYHEKVRRLHAERFSRMPFAAYKARIRMVTDAAVVQQWIEEQSFRLEYTCLNVPEPLKLSSREEVEAHFREHHLPNLALQVDKASIPAGGKLPPMSRELRLLGQRSVEEQRRFPLKTATVLSQQFARHGLQFFKVKRTITHVCVARPHYLNLETTVVSDGVRRIVDYIRTHERCRRRDLLEELAPTPPTPAPSAAPVEAEPTPTAAPEAPAVEAPPAPAPEAGAAAETETAAPVPAEAAEAAPAGAETKPAAAPPEPPAQPGPTPEQAAVIADLHWLIHQGHVIEFTSGHMELAAPPKPRPEPSAKKQKKKAAPKPAAAPTTVAAPPAETTTAPAPATPAPAPEPADTPATEPPPSAEPAVEPPSAPSEAAAETPTVPAAETDETPAPVADDLSATPAEVLGSAPATKAEPEPAAPAGLPPASTAPTPAEPEVEAAVAPEPAPAAEEAPAEPKASEPAPAEAPATAGHEGGEAEAKKAPEAGA